MQTGVGRTGTFFAWEQLGVKPDLVTLAKGLANGLPIGALLVADDAPRGFEPGDHATHLRRQPGRLRGRLRRRATRSTTSCSRTSRRAARELAAGSQRYRGVPRRAAAACCSPPSSTGPPADVVAACLERGLLVGTAGATTLRLTPPLTISADEARPGLSHPRGGARVSKYDRQGAILRLVQERELSTQSEVADALRDAGYDAVQTTVSRDIAQLGLVKVRAEERHARLRAARRAPTSTGSSELDRGAAPLGARARRRAGNLVVIQTPPGYANALAQAIDAAAAPRRSPARSPATTRSSSSRATASRARELAEELTPSPGRRHVDARLPFSPTRAGSTRAARSRG